MIRCYKTRNLIKLLPRTNKAYEVEDEEPPALAAVLELAARPWTPARCWRRYWLVRRFLFRLVVVRHAVPPVGGLRVMLCLLWEGFTSCLLWEV